MEIIDGNEIRARNNKIVLEEDVNDQGASANV